MITASRGKFIGRAWLTDGSGRELRLSSNSRDISSPPSRPPFSCTEVAAVGIPRDRRHQDRRNVAYQRPVSASHAGPGCEPVPAADPTTARPPITGPLLAMGECTVYEGFTNGFGEICVTGVLVRPRHGGG